jgi:hypothetical protein
VEFLGRIERDHWIDVENEALSHQIDLDLLDEGRERGADQGRDIG